MTVGDAWTFTQRLVTDNCQVRACCTIGEGVVFIGLSFGGNSQIWRSTDYGTTFSKVKDLAGVAEIYCIEYIDGELLAGTGQSAQVYSGGSDGDTWTLLGSLPTQSSCNTIVGVGGHLLAGSGVGGDLYASDDGGTTWTKTHDLTTYYVFSLIVLSSGTIVAGCSNGLYYSIDDGTTWKLGVAAVGYDVCEAGGGVVLAASSGGYVYRSIDDGVTWTKSSRLGSETTTYSVIYVGGAVCFAGTYSNARMYRSEDNGATWSYVQDLGSLETPHTHNGEIMAMVFLGGQRIVAPTGPWARVYLSGPLPVPEAEFTATPLFGWEPLEVQFTDESTNTPTSWLWIFGDGETSTEQNPLHTFAEHGSYTVSLQATNAAGDNTIEKPDYITVLHPPPPTPEFSPIWTLQIGPL